MSPGRRAEKSQSHKKGGKGDDKFQGPVEPGQEGGPEEALGASLGPLPGKEAVHEAEKDPGEADRGGPPDGFHGDYFGDRFLAAALGSLTCPAHWRATSPVVANQQSPFARMCLIRRSTMRIRWCWPITWGWHMKLM